MEKISKSVNEPKCLTDFKESRKIDGKPQTTTYKELPGDIKDEYKKALLSEQFFLCAYCNVLLVDSKEELKRMKIEHWKPQSKCEQDDNYGTIDCDDLNHQNMLLVCAGENQNPRYNHCDSARTEGSELTIKPQDKDYYFEKQLKYHDSRLIPQTEDKAIEHDLDYELNLNNDDMIDKRRYALDAVIKEILKVGKDKIDKKILLEKFSKPDSRNKKKQYCTYIRTYLFEKLTTSQK